MHELMFDWIAGKTQESDERDRLKENFPKG